MGLLNTLGSLGNIAGAATAAYLPYEAAGKTMEDLATQGPALAQQATALGKEAAGYAGFTPFSVRTATGGQTDVGAGGGYTMGLGAQEQAIQDAMASQLTGLTQQQLPTAQGLFDQMQTAQQGANNRARLELENRLAAQGRLGTRTAAYGGTPEQLAMEKAMQEQTAANFLQAQQLAPQIQGQNIQNMQGLLGNYYAPQQQQLAALGAGTNLANIATSAGLGQSEAIYKGGIEGLESQQAVNTALANLEASRVNALADALSGVFASTGVDGTGDSAWEQLLKSF